MDLTYFNNCKDNKPCNYDLSFEDLNDFMQDCIKQPWARSKKSDRPAAIFGRCKGRRAAANVQFLSCLGADIDISPSHPAYLAFDEMCHRLDSEGFAYIAHTTTTNCAAHNKYRLILPYAAPVAGQFGRSAWSLVNERFGGVFDQSTHDPSRLSFLPADWFEDEYVDSRGNQIKLEGAFNSFRYRTNGKPILTTDEIAMLKPVTVLKTAIGPSKKAMQNRSYSEPREIAALAKGHDDKWSGWSLLEDLQRSPLIKNWMTKKLPLQEGSRDYRFCKAVVRQALRSDYPIRLQTVVSLATQWSRKYLFRECNGIETQAQNALVYCYATTESTTQLVGPRQSDC